MLIVIIAVKIRIAKFTHEHEMDTAWTGVDKAMDVVKDTDVDMDRDMDMDMDKDKDKDMDT